MIFRSSHGIRCWSQLRLPSLGGHGYKLAPANLERVAGSIGIALARLRAGNGWASPSVTPSLCRRTYANKAVSRPKAHTGRTTSAPRKKAATRTGTKSAAPPKGNKAPAPAKRRPSTSAKSRSKTGRARKTTRAKPKAKRSTRKPLSQAGQLRLDKKTNAAEIRRLRERALSPPPPARGYNTWIAFLSEQRNELRANGDAALAGSALGLVKAMGAKFRAISPAQREHLNHLVNQRQAKLKVDYTKWREALTPGQILDANQARLALRHRGLKSWVVLKDERKVTGPRNAYIYYTMERRASGDYRGLSATQTVKLISSEWKATGAVEKKKYEDLQKQDFERYKQEYKTVYGFDPPIVKRLKSRTATTRRDPSTRASTATLQ